MATMDMQIESKQTSPIICVLLALDNGNYWLMVFISDVICLCPSVLLLHEQIVYHRVNVFIPIFHSQCLVGVGTGPVTTLQDGHQGDISHQTCKCCSTSEYLETSVA